MSAGRPAGPGVEARHRPRTPAAKGFPPPGSSEVHENERAAREMLAAFNRWDLETALAYLDPAVAVRSIGPALGSAVPDEGREALHGWLRELIADGLRPVLDVAHIRAAGGVVVALGHIHLETDPPTNADATRTITCRWVLRFREGRVAEVQVFADAPVPYVVPPGTGE